MRPGVIGLWLVFWLMILLGACGAQPQLDYNDQSTWPDWTKDAYLSCVNAGGTFTIINDNDYSCILPKEGR